jgi:hypothetical protein
MQGGIGGFPEPVFDAPLSSTERVVKASSKM